MDSTRLAHSKNKALPAALEAFNEASRIDPGDLEMVANRITILKDLGHFDQAEKLINELRDDQKLQTDVAQATPGYGWLKTNLLKRQNYFNTFANKDRETQAIGLIGLLHCADYATL